MKKFVVLAALSVAFLVLGTMTGTTEAQDKKEPKYPIKEVMKKFMDKGGIRDKILEDKASDDEKKQMIEFLEALHANKPPKGDAKAWDERTTAILKAAKDGDKDALKKATNCKTCHETFRPAKDK